MTTVDRYLVRLYFKALIIVFVSLAGLFVVVDGANNFDEFLSYGKRHSWGWAGVISEYYGPRLLQWFDQIGGLLAMLSAAFVLTIITRTNELTALVAAGISPARVLQPLLAASIAVTALGALNREIGLPRFRDSLSRNAQDWYGEKGRKCTPRYDIRTDVLIAGQSTFANEKRLAEPSLRLPQEFATWGRQITAENAYYHKATAEHPAGYLLTNVLQLANLAQLSSLSLDGEHVLLSPADTPWLKPNECFVVSVVTFEQLSVGGSWRQHLSSWELITGLRRQTIEPGADVRLALHVRFVQPLLDFSFVLMGVPLVLNRGTRNIFLAALMGIGLVMVVFVVELVCHAMGKNYLLSTTIAAWLPLLIFGPVSYTLARPLWD